MKAAFRPALYLSFAFLLFSACEASGPHFRSLEEEVGFRRVTLGGGKRNVEAGDGVHVQVRATPPAPFRSSLQEDSLRFLLGEEGGLWARMLSSMVEGDSSIFRLERGAFREEEVPYLHFPDRLDTLRLEVKLLEHLPRFALSEWRAKQDPKSIPAARWKEWMRIRDFVEERSEDPERYFSKGVYSFPRKKGDGPKVKEGRELALHYRGALPDGSVFDDSYARGEPLRFHYGAPKQVIRGVELGLEKMREGGKAELVIPSSLAFEKKSSSKGIPPPNSFVLYEIEVMEVGIP